MVDGVHGQRVDLPAERLSVVLLTHNCGHRIAPLLDRIAALDVPVVAVDNASTDHTVDMLRRMPGEVIELPRNIGAAARNVGAQRCTTPYVAFCDDDSWYEPDGLARAVDTLDAHPELALVQARILVEPGGELDPICAEMAASPLGDGRGLPGAVLLGFLAGFVVVRRQAFLDVGGYDPRLFIGGEEESVAIRLARSGWQLRYLPDVVAHHAPSLANAPRLHPYRLRNALWTCWLYRPTASAVRVTLATLAAAPKNAAWLRGVAMAVGGWRWVRRERSPMSPELDEAYRRLERVRVTHRPQRVPRSGGSGTRCAAGRESG